jgi:hypothetical protein
MKSRDKVAQEVMHSTRRLSSLKSGDKGEVSYHVVFISFGGTCRDFVHLERDTWVGATVVFLNGGFEVFRVYDRLETS